MDVWYNYVNLKNEVIGKIHGITGEIVFGVDKNDNPVKIEQNPLVKKYKIENKNGCRLVTKILKGEET